MSTYKHTQSVESTTWTINHSMGDEPAVDVAISIDGQMQKVFPLSVTHPTVNTTVITWTLARAGVAYLVS